MKEGDKDGAIAAAKYFMELYAFAYETWNLEPWEAMSGEGCEFCAGVSRNVRELESRGEYWLGGAPRWDDGTDYYMKRGGSQVHDVSMRATQERGQRLDKAGTELESTGGDEYLLKFSLLWDVDKWIVLGGGLENQSK